MGIGQVMVRYVINTALATAVLYQVWATARAVAYGNYGTAVLELLLAVLLGWLLKRLWI